MMQVQDLEAVRRKRMNNFVLQFDPSEISKLAARYGYEQDDEAFRAGSSIAAGNYTGINQLGALQPALGAHPGPASLISKV